MVNIFSLFSKARENGTKLRKQNKHPFVTSFSCLHFSCQILYKSSATKTVRSAYVPKLNTSKSQTENLVSDAIFIKKKHNLILEFLYKRQANLLKSEKDA